MERRVFNIRADAEIMAKLQVMAEEDNRTLANLIETILKRYVEEKEEK